MLLLDPGSGMDKSQDPGSGLNIRIRNTVSVSMYFSESGSGLSVFITTKFEQIYSWKRIRRNSVARFRVPFLTGFSSSFLIFSFLRISSFSSSSSGGGTSGNSISASLTAISLLTWTEACLEYRYVKKRLEQCCGIRDPVPFWPLDPGSGMGKKSGSGSGMNNPDDISDSLKSKKKIWSKKKAWPKKLSHANQWALGQAGNGHDQRYFVVFNPSFGHFFKGRPSSNPSINYELWLKVFQRKKTKQTNYLLSVCKFTWVGFLRVQWEVESITSTWLLSLKTFCVNKEQGGENYFYTLGYGSGKVMLGIGHSFLPFEEGQSRDPWPNACAPCHRRDTWTPGSSAAVSLPRRDSRAHSEPPP